MMNHPPQATPVNKYTWTVNLYLLILALLFILAMGYHSFSSKRKALESSWSNLENLWEQQHQLMNQITEEQVYYNLHAISHLRNQIHRASIYETRWNNQESLLEYLTIERQIVDSYDYVSAAIISFDKKPLVEELEEINSLLYDELCSFEEKRTAYNRRFGPYSLGSLFGMEDYGSMEIYSRDYILAGVYQ